MSSPHNSSPDNSTPDNSSPDNSTPDNSTPDNSNAPPKSSSSSSPSPPSVPAIQSSPTSPGSPPATPQNSLPNAKSPPPPHDGKDDNKVLIGAMVGGVFVILVLVIICVTCSRTKKKRKQKQKYYYGDPSHGKGSNYHNSEQHPHPNWSTSSGPHVSDHVVRMHQPGNGMGMGMGPPSGSWGPPPPPPHLMNSADMSSSHSIGQPSLPPPSPGLALTLKGGTFTYEELAAATNGFTNENIIGQGGFGYVHKGVLPNGKDVAVKSLKSGSGQGEREFQAEIDIISRVHHRHLVSLVGYCIWGGQRMLVYDFVPNQTLEHHLHGKGVPTMDWPTRLQIAIGSAKGLAYLHEDCNPRIIHRDIKASNVLLDYSFEAKVSDFGLAKLTTDTNTHVSTRVMGTFGYLAPEYAASGKLTEKSDVFSFGVMLLELITGKRPLDITNAMDDSLVDWARPLLSHGLEEDGNFGELVDPFLEGNYNIQQMARMAACAAASIRHSAKKRPKMSQIVRALEGDVSLDDLKEGMKPVGAGDASVHTSSSGSSDYDTMQYNADMMKFRKAIMSSQD